MRSTFTLIRRNSYPWSFAAIIAVILLVFCAVPAKHQSHALLLPIVGGAASFFHFLYSQHNHNTERFIELFRQFNSRYDKQNDKLNELVLQLPREPIFNPERLQTLYDYFNLCAEEYLYFRAGYIDSEVWRSWLKGMAHFAAIPEIRSVWQRELEQGSYYGFSLKLRDGAV